MERVTLTPAAADLLVKLTEIHGPLMFHQSGGCCDGSSPMCYPDGDFTIGGDPTCTSAISPSLAPIGFYMSESQIEYCKHTHLTVDVRRGAGPWQRILGRGTGGRPIHDPLAAVLRRGVQHQCTSKTADPAQHLRVTGVGKVLSSYGVPRSTGIKALCRKTAGAVRILAARTVVSTWPSDHARLPFAGRSPNSAHKSGCFRWPLVRRCPSDHRVHLADPCP
jgi:uncharacterized protein (DUF779 family)